MSEFRMKKLESFLLKEIGSLIAEKKIKDPRVTEHLNISRVVVSKDIHYAKIYVSSFEEHKKLEKSVKALNHAAGFIQSILGKKMHTRSTPKLTFIPDTSIKEGFEINRLIERSLH